MAEIYSFPTSEDREWAEWEEMIRTRARGAECPDRAIAIALPMIKEHWLAVYEPLTLELPQRPVAGELTKEQVEAIQSLTEASATLVADRLHAERKVAFQRLIEAELRAACFQVMQAPR
jgi:hypothetical protein